MWRPEPRLPRKSAPPQKRLKRAPGRANRQLRVSLSQTRANCASVRGLPVGTDPIPILTSSEATTVKSLKKCFAGLLRTINRVEAAFVKPITNLYPAVIAFGMKWSPSVA